MSESPENELKDPADEGKIPLEKRASFHRAYLYARDTYEAVLYIEWGNYDARPGGPLDYRIYQRYARRFERWANDWKTIPKEFKPDIINRMTNVPEFEPENFDERFEFMLRELSGACEDFVERYHPSQAEYSLSRAPTKSIKPNAARSYRKSDEPRDLAPLKAALPILGEWWKSEMHNGWPPDFSKTYKNTPRRPRNSAAKMLLAAAIEMGRLDDRATRDHDETDCMTALGGAK